MKKLGLWIFFLCMVCGMTGCDKMQDGTCRIHGVTTDENLDGVQVFLVPNHNDSQYNVDSVYIKDGKFEFASDTVMLAKIVVDYHYRMNVQPLLVMVEPGDVNVIIGQVSSAEGTPLNDSLQNWKTLTERHNQELGRLHLMVRDAKEGDPSVQERLKAQYDSAHLVYKQQTRTLASHLPAGELKEFLTGLYPLKYKLKKPDGSVVWMDADTRKELGIVEE